MVAIENAGGAAATAAVQVQVGGVTQNTPGPEATIAAAGGLMTIPFVADLALPIGTTSQIQLLVTASGGSSLIFTPPNATFMDVTEIPNVSG